MGIWPVEKTVPVIRKDSILTKRLWKEGELNKD